MVNASKSGRSNSMTALHKDVEADDGNSLYKSNPDFMRELNKMNDQIQMMTSIASSVQHSADWPAAIEGGRKPINRLRGSVRNVYIDQDSSFDAHEQLQAAREIAETVQISLKAITQKAYNDKNPAIHFERESALQRLRRRNRVALRELEHAAEAALLREHEIADASGIQFRSYKPQKDGAFSNIGTHPINHQTPTARGVFHTGSWLKPVWPDLPFRNRYDDRISDVVSSGYHALQDERPHTAAEKNTENNNYKIGPLPVASNSEVLSSRIMEERWMNLQQMQRDLEGISDVYRQIDTSIDGQGDRLDAIANDTAETSDQTSLARSLLLRSQRMTARGRCVWLILLMVMVVACIWSLTEILKLLEKWF